MLKDKAPGLEKMKQYIGSILKNQKQSLSF